MRLSVDPSEYKNYSYNTTASNERAIELVLAERFLALWSPDILEIGAVTPYYWPTSHEIADPFDTHDRVTNRRRAEEIDYTGRRVLSISTVEHIGEAGSRPEDALEVVKRIYALSRCCLVTFPLGAHPHLEEGIRRLPISMVYYVKVRERERVVWDLRTDATGFRYPSPEFGWAGAIAVVFKG